MNYLITYNHTQTSFSPTNIHNFIINLGVISDWWHYLPNVYIVTTESTEAYIADRIRDAFPGLLFLVIATNLTRHNGVLNKDAWEWISKKTRVLLKVKPAPSPPRDLLIDYLLPKQTFIPSQIPPSPVTEAITKLLKMKKTEGY